DQPEFFISSRRRHTSFSRDWSSDVCSSDLRLQKRLRPFRRMQLRIRGRMLQSLGEHSVILQALTDGDPVLAAETLRNHVLIQGERFHDLLSSYEKSPAGNRV